MIKAEIKLDENCEFDKQLQATHQHIQADHSEVDKSVCCPEKQRWKSICYIYYYRCKSSQGELYLLKHYDHSVL